METYGIMMKERRVKAGMERHIIKEKNLKLGIRRVMMLGKKEEWRKNK